MVWKKSLLTVGALAVLLMGISTADAHTRKGTWQLQGGAAFSSSSGDLYGGETRTNFTMSPGVHYFVVDKLMLGARAPVSKTKQGDVSTTSLYFGPAAAYYFGADDATTNPYLGAGVFYRQETFESGGGPVDYSQNGSSIGVMGGMALFLREYLALQPELSVNFESLEGTTGTTFMFGIGLAGFLY